jgi:hypothetical protein
MPINIFELAGYIPSLFEYKPHNLYGSIESILSEESDSDWNILLFHTEPETRKPSIE